jgi:hypothetical protein
MLKRSAANVRLNPEHHLKKSRAKKRCIENYSENDRNSIIISFEKGEENNYRFEKQSPFI